LRISYCCAVAGFGGASLTFVSVRTPNERLAEMVGMLGTGGFIGTVVGPLLGDCMFGSVAVTSTQVAEMFITAGLLGLFSMPFAWAATRGEVAAPRVLPAAKSAGTAREPSRLSLIRRYSSGVILVIVITMGMGLGLPSTFLRTYATELGIPRIGLFFLVYSVAAITIRVPTRRWTERFGPRRIIMVGLAIMVASVAAFPLVRTEWQLVFPAIGYGCSHGILWPAVVAAGSVTFPPQNRGLVTVLLLAAWDFGLVIASPAVGAMLKYSAAAGLPPYPTMFFSMAGFLGLVALWYAVVSADDVRRPAMGELNREQKAA
jgi:MFS family permease